MEAVSTASVSKIHPNTRISEEASPCSSEESGWTTYFDDFLTSKENKVGVSITPNVSLSSSLISDASSSRFISMNKYKRKKRAALCIYDDDDLLEDTACSSLNTSIHHEEIESDCVKQINTRDQAAKRMPNGFGFQAANGFDFGLNIVNGISKIECTELQYKRRHLSTLSSYVQGCS